MNIKEFDVRDALLVPIKLIHLTFLLNVVTFLTRGFEFYGCGGANPHHLAACFSLNLTKLLYAI